MKKAYKKPNIEVEIYSLSESIAANCDIVVNNGPAIGGHTGCDKYEDPFEGIALFSSASINGPFYDDGTCDCYTTGNNFGFWNS